MLVPRAFGVFFLRWRNWNAKRRAGLAGIAGMRAFFSSGNRVVMMGRNKPDIDLHEKVLRPCLKKKLIQIRAMHNGGYRPETLWLEGVDMCGLLADMGGAGLDVARGVVFRGIPVAGVITR